MKKIKNKDGLKDAIKSNVQLEDVVREYGTKLNGSSDVITGLCPFHTEKTPSFGVSLDKQLWYCHGSCKEGGDIFSFVQKMEALPFDAALIKLAEIAGVPVAEYMGDMTPEEVKADQLYKINADAANADICPRMDEWMSQRKFNTFVVEQYALSYCAAPRYTDDDADAKSLNLHSGMAWGDVIVTPIRDAYGRIAGFRNRRLGGGKPKLVGPNEKHPLPVPPIYGLFEARRAIREAGEAVLVEGEPDVWAMAQWGFKNTIGAMGSKLNDEQLVYLESVGVKRVTVLADNDDAGREFSKRVARTRYKTSIIIKIAILRGDGSDPDEVLNIQGPEAITTAIRDAKHAFEYLIDSEVQQGNPHTMTGKLDILSDLKSRMSSASNIERELAYSYLATQLMLDKEVIADFYRENTTTAEVQLYDTRNEKIVLATMLEDSTFLGEGVLALRVDDFYLERNRAAFSAMSDMFRNKMPVGYDSVRSYLKNKAPNAVPVVDQFKNAADVNSAPFLMRDVRDKAARRDIKKLGLDVALRIADTSVDAGTIAQGFSGKLAEAIVGGATKLTDARSLVNDRVRLMHERIKNPNAIIGLDFGDEWRALNRTLHGLQRKRYMVLAAPSGAGKTAVGCCWSRQFSVKLNEPVLYFTFETGRETLIDRITAGISGVETDKVTTGMISKDEIEEVHIAAAMVAEAPLMVTERGRTVEEAMAIIRHDVLTRGTRVIVVDYIQLMRMAEKPRGVSRHEELGIISEKFLEAAHDLDVSIVVLAQINRSGIKSGISSKEDIGDSYKIVQDADIVYLLREKSKDEIEESGAQTGDAFGLLDKHRHGKVGLGTSIVRDLSVMRIEEFHAVTRTR